MNPKFESLESRLTRDGARQRASSLEGRAPERYPSIAVRTYSPPRPPPFTAVPSNRPHRAVQRRTGDRQPTPPVDLLWQATATDAHAHCTHDPWTPVFCSSVRVHVRVSVSVLRRTHLSRITVSVSAQWAPPRGSSIMHQTTHGRP
ncbi:hypothetical protein L227DRAFT_175513 [Lentinus tigrinus ALCF2SS1-6]|uniref:Uncharacterized protein n=2 Tax=Lentinus tigrinus TaxID=5365 RepID=A0A5C2S529_9APHY|nr:hypothetical protein L227DRAFT_175513 [Lentinus tigrinus ALCF2SS1-6]